VAFPQQARDKEQPAANAGAALRVIIAFGNSMV